MTQLVTTGEVDLGQAGLSALIAGGSEAIQVLSNNLNVEPSEVLQEVTVEAQKVGEDLGNGNYL